MVNMAGGVLLFTTSIMRRERGVHLNKTDKRTGRQADRQTETDAHTDIQTDRQTNKQIYRQADRQTDNTGGQTDTTQTNRKALRCM